jgi:hypothetical protein
MATHLIFLKYYVYNTRYPMYLKKKEREKKITFLKKYNLIYEENSAGVY